MAGSDHIEARMERGARMLRTALGSAISALLRDPDIIEVMLNPDGRIWVDRLSYCRISDLVDSGVAKRQTAATYLKAMVSEGLLEEVKVGRENLYINPALLALLSERGQANI